MKKPRSRLRMWMRRVFFCLGILFALALAWSTWSAYTLVRDLPNPERITQRTVAESTKIYDRTGTVILYEIHGEERRTIIPLQEIPAVVRNATLTAEDAHFYEHNGIYWRGILRALWNDIRHGNVSQGGSTITQQLIKNSFLGNERTFTRKFKEAILAILVEKKYSKDRILEWYLNQISYGSNAYGIAAAAETYFGKKAQDLTTAEAALLAALPKAPTYYSPYGTHTEDLRKRKEWVLERMAASGLITKSEADQAAALTLQFSPPRESIRAPHFVMYVRERLIQEYGEDFVARGGLRVITTLDAKLQENAERMVREGAERNEKLVNAKNAALIALDPKTGDILAMVGSRDYFDLRNDGNVNVTLRPRQPGSAFKPFIYATALQKGYTPETVLFDVATEFNPRCDENGAPQSDDAAPCYHPRDFDGKFRGPVTLRQALAQSLNVPSVKLLYLAGIPDVIKTAQTMGITTLTDPDRYGLSLVLGGAEVSLLEMTSAFGAFSQDGILHPKNSILRIEDARGALLYEKKDSSLPVLDTEVARTINEMLSDNEARVPVFQRQNPMYFPDRQVAAKTGTTENYRDAWVIGYTPSIVVGVWVGNNDPRIRIAQGSFAVAVASPIWHSFMESVISAQPPEAFTKPLPRAPAQKPALDGSYRADPFVKIDKVSGKRATENTPPEFIQELGFGEIHSLLAFVRRGDPLGQAPENPNDDPQYHNWEEGIKRWLALHPLPLVEAPPQGFDELHTEDKKPRISIASLENSTTIPQDIHSITATIIAPFSIQEASLFIDDELQDSKTGPFSEPSVLFQLPQTLEVGDHQLRVVTYDTVGNRATLERTITALPASPVKINESE